MNIAIAERVHALALKIRKYKAGIDTEEATKNAFVLPFISTVPGYDVVAPNEVIPEFVADVGVGTKKGEKIVHNGQVHVLVGVKKITDFDAIPHQRDAWHVTMSTFAAAEVRRS